MFVFLVLCFVRVEKNIKNYGNLIIFVIIVIFDRGMLCQGVAKMS